MFVGKIPLLRAACSPLLRARIFIHSLESSDCNLFWATIVTGDSHQLLFSFDHSLSRYDGLETKQKSLCYVFV